MLFVARLSFYCRAQIHALASHFIMDLEFPNKTHYIWNLNPPRIWYIIHCQHLFSLYLCLYIAHFSHTIYCMSSLHCVFLLALRWLLENQKLSGSFRIQHDFLKKKEQNVTNFAYENGKFEWAWIMQSAFYWRQWSYAK